MYEIEEYVVGNGKSPYGDWFSGLKDGVARAKLTSRIDRAAHGNFGDWKPIEGGLCEMREHYGPGYRILYSIVGKKILLVLAGSDKKDQARTIRKAREYLEDYRWRTKQ